MSTAQDLYNWIGTLHLKSIASILCPLRRCYLPELLALPSTSLMIGLMLFHTRKSETQCDIHY